MLNLINISKIVTTLTLIYLATTPKLFSDDSQISSQTFAKISNLRSQGEEKLRIGELDNAEEIFDRALALLKK